MYFSITIFFDCVPKGGLEPPPHFWDLILSQARLPVPPLRHTWERTLCYEYHRLVYCVSLVSFAIFIRSQMTTLLLVRRRKRTVVYIYIPTVQYVKELLFFRLNITKNLKIFCTPFGTRTQIRSLGNSRSIRLN